MIDADLTAAKDQAFEYWNPARWNTYETNQFWEIVNHV